MSVASGSSKPSKNGSKGKKQASAGEMSKDHSNNVQNDQDDKPKDKTKHTKVLLRIHSQIRI